MPRCLLFTALILLAACPSRGAETDIPRAGSVPNTANWLSGEGVSLGGVLFPHIHGLASYGGSTGDPGSLLSGHHDPDRDGWTIQNVEFGFSGRFSHHFEAFTTYAAKVDLDDRWDGHFEEWFGNLKNLPGGFELRGGQFYNRFGLHNHVHPHGFDFVDQHLVSGRFLGEDSLTTTGGEVTWKLPANWTSLLSVSVGIPPELDEHGHIEEEGEEPEFEAEGALFDDVFVVANWTNQFDYDDFHQFRGGLSGAWGENAWGKTSQVYGAHFEYQWRQNGYEAGGRYFRWRTEAMLRSFDAVSGHLPGEEEDEHHEEDHEGSGRHEDEHEAEHVHEEDRPRRGSLTEFGLYSSIAYGFDNGFELGLRGDFVSGISRAGLDERFRISPAVTYYFNDSRSMFLRVQYNWDHSSDLGSESGIWGQIGVNWGGPEVR